MSESAAAAPTTRFAPAPTGRLHLGHLATAIYVWGLARRRPVMAVTGRCEVYRREGVPDWVFYRGVAWAFTRRLQGFDIPASGGRNSVVRVVTR